MEEYTKWSFSNENSKFQTTFDHLTKAKLLQLNRTQFPSLGILLVKILEIQNITITFIISVLKVVY